MERETGDRVGGQEVQEMQRAVEAWQAQATEAHQVCLSEVVALSCFPPIDSYLSTLCLLEMGFDIFYRVKIGFGRRQKGSNVVLVRLLLYMMILVPYTCWVWNMVTPFFWRPLVSILVFKR